jgi:LysM repeat protein
LFNEWRANPDNWHDCDYCVLASLKIQVENGVSYAADSEKNLRSLTASCSATGYDFVRPPPYSLPVTGTKTTTTTSPTAVPSEPCLTPYTIQPGDTCDSISQANNVSTFGLIYSNGFMMPCQPLKPGRHICLPLTCQTHLLASGETCYTLSKQYRVTRAQLIDWNENFDLDCLNINRWVGTYVCAR